MKQRIIISIAVVAGVLLAATAAFAAGSGTLTSTATVGGTAGISLNLPANPALSDTIDGSDQTVSYSPILGVVDARGTGTGWNVTVSSTTYSDGSGHTLQPGSVTGVAQACHSGSSCTAATSSGISYPMSVTGTASKLFSAAANTGMGKIDVTPTIQVLIPGNAYAGTYTSTLTLATVSGP